eukprot:TRINITY_DN24182_c0_g1_i1.p1 TRINITY_DN24182_c0_g1~~TRINITY_DN24182_c0_g1_i1.p1  ORF type:complete len:544 (+),score=102.39 TRINITY_DN24182_c0_g1_i1:150-1781(+)
MRHAISRIVRANVCPARFSSASSGNAASGSSNSGSHNHFPWGARDQDAPPQTHSHLRGHDITYLEGSVGYYLSTQTRKLTHRDAFRMTHQGINWTWLELKKQVDALAGGLLEMGGKMYSRVLILEPMSAELFVTILACQKAGMIPVVVPHEDLSADRLSTFLHQFTPNIVITRQNLLVGPNRTVDMLATVQALWPELSYVPDGAPLRRNKRFTSVRKVLVTNRPVDSVERAPGVLDLRNCMVHGPFGYYEHPLRRTAHYLVPDRFPGFVVATGEHPASRVDDAPELFVASVHTHGNIVNGGRALAATLGLSHHDRVSLLPGGRATALTALVPMACLTSGATFMCPAESLEVGAQRLVERLAYEEPTVVVGTLTLLRRLVDSIASGAVRVQPPAGQIRTVVVYVPPSFTQWAGSSALAALCAPGGDADIIREAFRAESVVAIGGPQEAMGYLFAQRDADTALAPNTEVRVTQKKGAVVVPRGKTGALHMKGAHVSALYWNNVGLMSAEVDATGHIRPGWTAQVDQQGLLSVGTDPDTGAVPLIY